MRAESSRYWNRPIFVFVTYNSYLILIGALVDNYYLTDDSPVVHIPCYTVLDRAVYTKFREVNQYHFHTILKKQRFQNDSYKSIDDTEKLYNYILTTFVVIWH